MWTPPARKLSSLPSPADFSLCFFSFLPLVLPPPPHRSPTESLPPRFRQHHRRLASRPQAPMSLCPLPQNSAAIAASHQRQNALPLRGKPSGPPLYRRRTNPRTILVGAAAAYFIASPTLDSQQLSSPLSRPEKPIRLTTAEDDVPLTSETDQLQKDQTPSPQTTEELIEEKQNVSTIFVHVFQANCKTIYCIHIMQKVLHTVELL